MKLGIVGLPNVGKSTLFNSVTKGKAESANYPFCTIDPNVGIVTVKDERLNTLYDIYNSEKIIEAIIEFVDIAGLVKGASKGEGLGNQFLSHIREVDAILHVVRCFDNENVIHVESTTDPLRDIDIINIELMLSDMETVDRRLTKVSKLAKQDKAAKKEEELLLKVKDLLENDKAINKYIDELIAGDEENAKYLHNLSLITSKKVIYAANVDENDLGADDNDYVKKVREFAKAEGSAVYKICAKLEEEIREMSEEEKQEFLGEYGVTQSGLDSLISASYDLLGLCSFLTAGPKEIRAWTIEKGTKAPAAAGKIHSDIERGFIRAEVVHYDDLVKHKNMAQAKEHGLVRQEGKEYIVKDGDVILFKFNV